MNRIRTAAAAVAMLVGAATVAGAQTPAPQGQAGKAHRGAHGTMGGLEFTDAQKAQMKAIHAKYRTQLQQLRERSRPDMEAARTARQAGDTAAARAAMARVRAARGPAVAALRQQQHAEIRAILTADQQARFDAHRAQMQQRKARGDSTGKRVRPRGMHKRPMRGERPARKPAGT
jgi:Spy/CpxP family protein refolding chaperone